MMQLHVLEDIDMLSDSPFIYTILDNDYQTSTTYENINYRPILPKLTRDEVGYFDPVSLARETIAYNDHDLDDLLLPDEPHPKGIWEGGAADDEDYYNHMFQDYNHR